MTFVQGLLIVVKNRTYLNLIFMFIFVWMIMAVSQTNFLLFVMYTLGRGDHFVRLLVVLLCCTLLGLPLVAVAIRKIGKRNTYICGLVVWRLPLLTGLFRYLTIIVISSSRSRLALRTFLWTETLIFTLSTK